MVTVTCSDSHIDNSIRQTSPTFYSEVHALICQSLTFSSMAQPHKFTTVCLVSCFSYTVSPHKKYKTPYFPTFY